MDVTLHQDLDVELEQALECREPAHAVHVRVGRGEVGPHEAVTGQQDAGLGVVEDDVVSAMSRRRQHDQPAVRGRQLRAQRLDRAVERLGLADHDAADGR
jgi:hypothetical protein